MKEIKLNNEQQEKLNNILKQETADANKRHKKPDPQDDGNPGSRWDIYRDRSDPDPPDDSSSSSSSSRSSGPDDETSTEEDEPGRMRRRRNRDQGKLKCPTPSNYDGSRRINVVSWLFEVEQYFDATHVTRGRTAYAAMLLKGHAQIWWMAKKTNNDHPRRWEQFKRALTRQFQSIDANRKARDRLGELKQTNSVENYITDFTTLAFQTTDMSEVERFHAFRAGLKPHIRHEMDLMGIENNLEVLQLQALRYDEIKIYQNTTSYSSDYKKPMYNKRFEGKRYDNRRKFHKKEFHQIDAKEITCYNCDKKGHYAKDCRSKKKIPSKGHVSWKDKKKGPETTKINLIETVKVEDTASLPKRGTPGSAGLDLTPSQSGVIPPFKTVKIPTGRAFKIPDGSYGSIHSRSSVLSKGIFITGIIDSDYTGPVYLIAHNNTDEPKEYSKDGKPIAQMVISPCSTENVIEVEKLPPTTRNGGFGSTNLDRITAQPGKLTFEGKVNGRHSEILIDSGADGNFCGKNLAKDLNLKTNLLKEPITITVTNGEEAVITREAKDVHTKSKDIRLQ